MENWRCKTPYVLLLLLALVVTSCGKPATLIPPPMGVPATVTERAATSTPKPTITPLPSPTPSVMQIAVQLATQVNADRLMAGLHWLADDARRGRLTGSPEEDQVGVWLVQRFQELDLQPFAAAQLEDYYLPFAVPAVTHYGRAAEGETAMAENVIAVLPGTTQPDNYVYIGAHYDHLGVSSEGEVFNGADDDATGVTAVLEAARILSTAKVRPQETIVFVAFSGEEIGALGSEALCHRLMAANLTHHSMLLNMEVLGADRGTGTYLNVWDEDVSATKPLVEAVQLAGDRLGVPVEQRGRDPGSDAVRLVACGIPAVSVDVAWSRENHSCYHQPCDDPQRIDVEGFENAVRVAVAALWLLANDGE